MKAMSSTKTTMNVVKKVLFPLGNTTSNDAQKAADEDETLSVSTRRKNRPLVPVDSLAMLSSGLAAAEVHRSKGQQNNKTESKKKTKRSTLSQSSKARAKAKAKETLRPTTSAKSQVVGTIGGFRSDALSSIHNITKKRTQSAHHRSTREPKAPHQQREPQPEKKTRKRKKSPSSLSSSTTSLSSSSSSSATKERSKNQAVASTKRTAAIHQGKASRSRKAKAASSGIGMFAMLFDKENVANASNATEEKQSTSTSTSTSFQRGRTSSRSKRTKKPAGPKTSKSNGFGVLGEMFVKPMGCGKDGSKDGSKDQTEQINASITMLTRSPKRRKRSRSRSRPRRRSRSRSRSRSQRRSRSRSRPASGSLSTLSRLLRDEHKRKALSEEVEAKAKAEQEISAHTTDNTATDDNPSDETLQGAACETAPTAEVEDHNAENLATVSEDGDAASEEHADGAPGAANTRIALPERDTTEPELLAATDSTQTETGDEISDAMNCSAPQESPPNKTDDENDHRDEHDAVLPLASDDFTESDGQPTIPDQPADNDDIDTAMIDAMDDERLGTANAASASDGITPDERETRDGVYTRASEEKPDPVTSVLSEPILTTSMGSCHATESTSTSYYMPVLPSWDPSDRNDPPGAKNRRKSSRYNLRENGAVQRPDPPEETAATTDSLKQPVDAMNEIVADVFTTSDRAPDPPSLRKPCLPASRENSAQLEPHQDDMQIATIGTTAGQTETADEVSSASDRKLQAPATSKSKHSCKQSSRRQSQRRRSSASAQNSVSGGEPLTCHGGRPHAICCSTIRRDAATASPIDMDVAMFPNLVDQPASTLSDDRRKSSAAQQTTGESDRPSISSSPLRAVATQHDRKEDTTNRTNDVELMTPASETRMESFDATVSIDRSPNRFHAKSRRSLDEVRRAFHQDSSFHEPIVEEVIHDTDARDSPPQDQPTPRHVAVSSLRKSERKRRSSATKQKQNDKRVTTKKKSATKHSLKQRRRSKRLSNDSTTSSSTSNSMVQAAQSQEQPIVDADDPSENERIISQNSAPSSSEDSASASTSSRISDASTSSNTSQTSSQTESCRSDPDLEIATAANSSEMKALGEENRSKSTARMTDEAEVNVAMNVSLEESKGNVRRSRRSRRQTNRFGTYMDASPEAMETNLAPNNKKQQEQEEKEESREEQHVTSEADDNDASSDYDDGKTNRKKRGKSNRRVSALKGSRKSSSNTSKSPVKKVTIAAGVDGVPTSSVRADEWTQDELSLLHSTRSKIDPLSSTFWCDVAERMPNRSAAECQDKFFSLVKTPTTKAARMANDAKSKASERDSCMSSPEEDDIFDATPMKELFPISGLPPLDVSYLANLDLGSAIKAKPDHDLSLRPNHRPKGYKTYLMGLKRDINRENKLRSKMKQRQKQTKKSLVSIPARKTVSDTVFGDGSTELRGKLSPGCTLHVQNLGDSDSDGDQDMDVGAGSSESDDDFF